jgi:hypothetical protein
MLKDKLRKKIYKIMLEPKKNKIPDYYNWAMFATEKIYELIKGDL